jgi:hypothetical protein
MSRSRIGLDLALFLLTLGLAWRQHWSVTDLVWGLWISSLVLGYAFIIVSIGAVFGAPTVLAAMDGKGAAAKRNVSPGCQSMVPVAFMLMFTVFVLGFNRLTLYALLFILPGLVLAIGGAMRHKPGWERFPDPDKGLAKAVILLPYAIFMLAFFTVHFGGFHFVHSIFLNGFFPIVQDSPFGKGIDETFAYFFMLVRESFHRYWPFVLAGGLSRLPDYAAAFRAPDGSLMFKPYLNVVRMHIMIFIFAGMAAAGLKDAALYPLLVLYFFPFGELFKAAFSRKTPPAGTLGGEDAGRP